MNRLFLGTFIGAAMPLWLSSPCFGQPKELAAEAKWVSAADAPDTATFYSLTLLQPPFPFNPFPELPLYQIGERVYVYDDSKLDYPALRALWAQEATVQSFAGGVMLAGGTGSGGGMMLMSGGGGNFPYTSGLQLTIPRLTNGAVLTSLMESDTNSAYDLFETFALRANTIWARIASTEIGGTNFAVTQVSAANAFYLAAETTDSDFDGLSDAYEKLVSRTSPLNTDSDGDGLPDGAEDFNGNGVPDRFDYQRLTRAVIFASRTNAFEGGQPGELTFLLPSPAPAGGATITLHLGGNTDYGTDFT
jgi:hypothetical protein